MRSTCLIAARDFLGGKVRAIPHSDNAEQRFQDRLATKNVNFLLIRSLT
jgi:hypothetical protein